MIQCIYSSMQHAILSLCLEEGMKKQAQHCTLMSVPLHAQHCADVCSPVYAINVSSSTTVCMRACVCKLHQPHVVYISSVTIMFTIYVTMINIKLYNKCFDMLYGSCVFGMTLIPTQLINHSSYRCRKSCQPDSRCYNHACTHSMRTKVHVPC